MQSQRRVHDGLHSHLQSASLGGTRLPGGIVGTSGAQARWNAWDAPTLGELAERVEHQFGDLSALGGIHTLGFARDEPLTPSDVYLVCDLLGLPAEDFGLDI